MRCRDVVVLLLAAALALHPAPATACVTEEELAAAPAMVAFNCGGLRVQCTKLCGGRACVDDFQCASVLNAWFGGAKCTCWAVVSDPIGDPIGDPTGDPIGDLTPTPATIDDSANESAPPLQSSASARATALSAFSLIIAAACFALF